MRINEILAEDEIATQSTNAMDSFIPFVQQELGIDNLPNIIIVDAVPGVEGTTFGMYNQDKNCVYLVTQGRHPRDVMRTLAHELVHFKQHQEHTLDSTSGETGSDAENEANAVAGVVMRNFNQENPDE